MGRTITPKYQIVMSAHRSVYKFAWKGRATAQLLERYVMEFTVSTYPGYANERVGQAYGINIPSKAEIRLNRAPFTVVAEWRAPMFVTLPKAEDYPKVAKATSTEAR